jgi:hypothetical protein
MLMSTLYDARKHFAAAVMITFLATTVSAIAIEEAGRRAVEVPKSACAPQELEKPMLLLELGLPLSLGDRDHALCILRGLGQRLDADNFFLLSYGALNLAIFLFLVALGRARPPWLWISAGLLLALVMLSADLRENQFIRQWIELAATVAPSALLFTATAVKWGALAAASALLGLIYLFHPGAVAKLVALPAFASTALLAAGLYQRCPDWVNDGAAGLFLLWLAILIHAVIVAIEPPPPGVPQTAGEGKKNA